MADNIDIGLNDPFRPNDWDGIIGQTALKERLEIHITSALVRGTRLGHVLLIASPGYGKTTIARMIAQQMCTTYLGFTMPVADAMLDAVVTRFKGVVFLDELHSAPTKFQERLLPLIEDHYIQNTRGQRVVNNNLTIIAATTEPQKVIAPLHQRFDIVPSFDEYTNADMARIIHGMAERLNLPMSWEQCIELSGASAATPRQAKQLIVMTQDLYAAVGTMPTTADILARCRISDSGLTEDHRRYVETLAQLGGVAGVKLVGNHLRLPESVLLDLELLLVKQKLVTYTKRGRELTADGWSLTGAMQF